MPPRRSKPLFIASFIPLWGILAFVGVQRFGGTRYFALFLALISAAFLALFVYVARGAMAAHKTRKAQRKIPQ